MLNKIRNHKVKLNTKIIFGIVVVISFFNILAITCRGFANWYRENIFHAVSGTVSRVIGLLPFSLGEVMICLGLLLLALAVVVFVIGFARVRVLKKIRRLYFRGVVYVLVFIYFTETFNCFMLYHADTLEETLQDILADKNMGDIKIDVKKEINAAGGGADDIDTNRSDENTNNIEDQNTDDIVKLLAVYNYVVGQLNEISVTLPRDSKGYLTANYTYEDCKQAMNNLSEDFSLLKGYYPNPKKIYYSNIMSQQYLAGIYFPFSMEANYNRIMYCSNMPATICHELSHLKGYIREDEANFIAYLACIHSDNDFIKYSGYLSVLYYLRTDLITYGEGYIIEQMKSVNDYVTQDEIFLRKEVFEEVEQKAVISTEVMSEATDKFLESNLKVNGVSSGMDNYSEVVKLLLIYYT